jgi:hypothetical protein
VHRLDQINAKKPANLLDFRSLTLKFRSKLIGRFFYVTRQLGNVAFPPRAQIRIYPSAPFSRSLPVVARDNIAFWKDINSTPDS